MGTIIGLGFKLYYKSKIEGIVKPLIVGGGEGSHALKVQRAIDTVFGKMNLSTTFEKHKKKAIKSVLKDHLAAYKAEHLDSLLETVRIKINGRDIKGLSLEELEDLTGKIQSEHPQFKHYEIRYILKDPSRILRSTAGKKKFFPSTSEEERIKYSTELKQSEKLDLLALIHKQAKGPNRIYDLQVDVLAKMLGKDRLEIEKETLRLCGQDPKRLPPEQIRKQLATISPEVKIEKCKKIIAYMRLIYIAGVINPDCKAILNEIINGDVKLAFGQKARILDRLSEKGEVNGPLLDLLSEISHLGIVTTYDVGNDDFYKELDTQLKNKWQESFGNQTRLSKIFNDRDLDRHNTLRSNALLPIASSLDNAASKFIHTTELKNESKFENKYAHEILEILSKEFKFTSASIYQIMLSFFKDEHDDTSKTDRAKLFTIMHSIPDSVALRINEFLKNPIHDKSIQLTPVEAGYLTKLLLAMGENKKDIKRELKEISEKREKLKYLLPDRKENPGLDLEIIEGIYKIQLELLTQEGAKDDFLRQLYADAHEASLGDCFKVDFFAKMLEKDRLEIEKETLRLCGQDPNGLSPKQIKKQLATISPEVKIEKCKKIIAYVRLIYIAGTINPDFKAILNEITNSNAKLVFGQKTKILEKLAEKGEINGPLLDLLSEISHLGIVTTCDVGNDDFYKELDTQLKNKWQESFGNQATLSKIFNDRDLDRDNTLRSNALVPIVSSLDNAASIFIHTTELKNKSEFENKYAHEILEMLTKEFKFTSASIYQIMLSFFKDEHDSMSNTDRAKLFTMMHSIPDPVALRINEFLKNPIHDKSIQLTPVERGHLTKLLLAMGGSKKDIKRELQEVRTGKLKYLLPDRKENPGLDLEIIEGIYEAHLKRLTQEGAEDDLLIQLYVDAYEASLGECFKGERILPELNETFSYDITDMTEAGNKALVSYFLARPDIKEHYGKTEKWLEGGEEALPQDILNLKLIPAFRREALNSPQTEFYNGGVVPTTIIPDYISLSSIGKGPVINLSIAGEEHERAQVPVHIKMIMQLKEMSGNDDALFYKLQTLCGQTICNRLFSHMALSDAFYQAMGCSESDSRSAIGRVLFFPAQSGTAKRTLTKESDTKISYTIETAVRVLDTTTTHSKGVYACISGALEKINDSWCPTEPSVKLSELPKEEPSPAILDNGNQDNASSALKEEGEGKGDPIEQISAMANIPEETSSNSNDIEGRKGGEFRSTETSQQAFMHMATPWAQAAVLSQEET